MPPGPALTPVAALVRRHDPDRFLCALFAPAGRREALLTLCAFNHELARARDAVSQGMLALIRLQWWREVVEGAHRRHEVAEPLTRLLDEGALDRGELLAMVDGREVEAEAMASLADWRAYLLATAGGVAVAAARLLGAPGESLPGVRLLGAAYGTTGVLRSVPALARRHRCLLPEDVLAEHGLSPEAVIADPGAATLGPVLARLADEGRGMLREGRNARPGRRAIAAVLPAVLARRDLRRVGRPPAPRGVGDRAAVLAAAVAGRV